MSNIDVVSLVSVAKSNPQRLKALRKHLRDNKTEEHGTEKCYYCGYLAVDMGLLRRSN